MADDTQNKKGGDGKKKPPGNFEFPVSTWLVWIVIIGSIIALVAVNQKMRTPSSQVITSDEFSQKFDAGLIAHATIEYTPQSYPNVTFNDINGAYYKTDKDGNIAKENGKPVEIAFTALQVPVTTALLDKYLASHKFSTVQQNTILLNLLTTFAPFLLIGILFWFSSSVRSRRRGRVR